LPERAMDLNGAGGNGRSRITRTPYMHLFALLRQALGHLSGIVAHTSRLRRILGRDDMQPFQIDCSIRLRYHSWAGPFISRDPWERNVRW
jgi:hypothetical protein